MMRLVVVECSDTTVRDGLYQCIPGKTVVDDTLLMLLTKCGHRAAVYRECVRPLWKSI